MRVYLNYFIVNLFIALNKKTNEGQIKCDFKNSDFKSTSSASNGFYLSLVTVLLTFIREIFFQDLGGGCICMKSTSSVVILTESKIHPLNNIESRTI